MSYLAMSAASLDNNEFNFNNNNNGTNSINRKRQKTLKSRSPQEFNPQKVNSVLKSIHQNTDGDGDDDEEDTYPYNNNKGSPFPAKPISMGAERKKVEEGMTNRQSSLVPQPMDKEAWTTQDLQQAFMNDGQVRDYYRKVLSSSSPSVASSYKATTTNSSVSGSNDIMIEKLNYLINLLEEQQDQKTESVAEEVVLYSFLGIFIIFVVDSFSRVGKYVR